MVKCVNLIEIQFYAYLYASSFLVLWDHCADAGSWIRGQIRIYEGKYGYLSRICSEGEVKLMTFADCKYKQQCTLYNAVIVTTGTF
jgi:hypothetical protein